MITMSFLRLAVRGGDVPVEPNAPVYLMTEPLIDTGSVFKLEDSANVGDNTAGILEHTGDDLSEGTPWYPITNVEVVYPQNGTIDLVVVGEGTRQINTQWTPPSDSEWTFMACYDVIDNVSYSMYAIHYKGNLKADIYLGDQDTELTLTYSDVDYTPPTTSLVVLSTPPEIIEVTSIVYDMSTFNTV